MQKKIKDKIGRDIILEIDDYYFMSATHNGCKIGEFDYHVYECDNGYANYTEEYFELTAMNIDCRYQKAGIGTEMIIFGEDVLKRVSYPEDTGSRHGNHLSLEGKALIDSCIIKGIISVPSDLDDCDEYDDEYNEYLLSQLENER
ncbi:MAG: hypothetical protein RR942_13885 [Romboutsia sp.]